MRSGNDGYAHCSAAQGDYLPGRSVNGHRTPALLNSLRGMCDAAILALLYGCGLRRSEVVGIDIEQLNLKEHSIRILGKGNRERVVYPPERAWQMLSEWSEEGLKGRDNGPLFCRIRKGGVLTTERLTDQALYFVIRELFKKTSIESFSPHDLRGSFIFYLLDNGHDIKTVADIVGHEPPQAMTNAVNSARK